MKTLYLARHAKSDWHHPGLADHERPLNDRGRHDAPRMGAFLAHHYPPPQRILSSTAARAHTTAALLAKALAVDDVQHLPQLYLADVAGLMAVIHALDDDLDRVMLVAHNPGLTECVNALSPVGLDNLPTCGVARIGFDLPSWGMVDSGLGRLLSLDRPKALPSD